MKSNALPDSSIQVRAAAPLCEYTTFRLGGPCRVLYFCQAPDDLKCVIEKLVQEGTDFILIGGGSNLVVSDRGLEVAVIRYLSERPLIQKDGNDLIVSGSTILDHAVLFALEHSLSGLNYASGIPGTVGGAVVGNAGAWGKQIGDVIQSVKLISRQGLVREVSPSDVDFTYRNSKLKETGDIVLEVRIGCTPGDPVVLDQERKEILKMRKDKHPDLDRFPCAGSFFRNIEPTSKADRRQAAGFFLEQSGVKNFSVGGAGIFEKHANIIIKKSGCTAQDVHDLSLKMTEAVKEKFRLELVREVRFVGEFEGKPKSVHSAIW